MHTLLPGGLLLHADAPKAFCSQLQSEGTLALMKVNADASSAAKRLEVSLSHFASASSSQHAQTRPCAREGQLAALHNGGELNDTSPGQGSC